MLRDINRKFHEKEKYIEILYLLELTVLYFVLREDDSLK